MEKNGLKLESFSPAVKVDHVLLLLERTWNTRHAYNAFHDDAEVTSEENKRQNHKKKSRHFFCLTICLSNHRSLM